MKHRRQNNPVLYALTRFFERNQIRDCSVVCAFSGGADSVSLLWALDTVRDQFGIELSALHVHHGIRGAEAERDEEFCRAFCADRQIPFIARRVDAPAYAEREKVSLETAARVLRYQVFARVQETSHAIIATAHHAGDQAETMLFRLARGTGLTGLCGIPPICRGVIRPLLGVTPEEIRATIASLGLPHVEDTTNGDMSYARNYIRHDILPKFKTLNPSAVEHLSETASLLRQDSDFLEGEARRRLTGVPTREMRVCLREEHPAIAYRMIRILYAAVQKSPDALTSEQIENVMRLVCSDTYRGALDLPENIRVTVEGDSFSFSLAQKQQPPLSDTPLFFGVNHLVERDGCLVLSHTPIRCEMIPEMKVYNFVTSVSFYSATIIGNLYVRSRREGDAYRYGGMTHKLRKLFNDVKMPSAMRKKYPVVCDDAGILWVPGFGVREQTNSGDMEKIYACYGTREENP